MLDKHRVVVCVVLDFDFVVPLGGVPLYSLVDFYQLDERDAGQDE